MAQIKRICQNNPDEGDDGRPETVSGAVGYVVKYCLKDAAEAVRRGAKRRSLLVSQGDGYHSEDAREERREWRAANSGANAADSGIVEDWTPMRRGVASGYEDTLTPADRERFADFDTSLRTQEYKEKSKMPGYGDVWTVYRYDRRTETVEWTVWDRWPEAEGARVLEVHLPNAGSSRPNAP